MRAAPAAFRHLIRAPGAPAGEAVSWAAGCRCVSDILGQSAAPPLQPQSPLGLRSVEPPGPPPSPSGRIEKALRRFRKQTNMVGHLRIIRNRKTFESAHDKKIRKAKESAMRQARARRSARARF